MNMQPRQYWNQRYLNKNDGWDIGYASPPIIEYLPNINKSAAILIPGAGHAHEALAMVKMGYQNVHVCDFSSEAIKSINTKEGAERLSLHSCDFFSLKGQYDYIIEQTFLSALPKNIRRKYAQKMHELLKTNGILIGVLFASPFEKEGPPFGGTKEDYIQMFSPYFKIDILEPCYNSIPSRSGNELFIKLTKIS